MIEQLVKKFNCKVNGDIKQRLSNNINVTFPQCITGEALIYLLDTSSIYISSGSACNSHLNQPSYVLKAIGLTDEEATRTIRITLSDEIDKEIVDKVICEIEKCIKLLTT
jgi:cysteine desulfurase